MTEPVSTVDERLAEIEQALTQSSAEETLMLAATMRAFAAIPWLLERLRDARAENERRTVSMRDDMATIKALQAERDELRAKVQRVEALCDEWEQTMLTRGAARVVRAAMSEPTQTCKVCGRVEVVRMDGRDIAKRKLKKACKAAGCPCDPQYLAGLWSR